MMTVTVFVCHQTRLCLRFLRIKTMYSYYGITVAAILSFRLPSQAQLFIDEPVAGTKMDSDVSGPSGHLKNEYTPISQDNPYYGGPSSHCGTALPSDSGPGPLPPYPTMTGYTSAPPIMQQTSTNTVSCSPGCWMSKCSLQVTGCRKAVS